jgi:1,4-alpha-glucan branching enzyme
MTPSGNTGSIPEPDLFLFNQGTHRRAYLHLGAHLASEGGTSGAAFRVWAPSAREVSVIGDMNGWDEKGHTLAPVGTSGIHAGFVPRVEAGAHYKLRITTAEGRTIDKADPYAFCAENAPKTASRVWDLAYTWGDADWMVERAGRQKPSSPISIYEVHLGSWKRKDGRHLSYRELAPLLAEHARARAFTHVELMPITEHPFYGSWGYQTTGYFAPTSRYGSPQDLMFLVDTLHQAGIGVILDWVPAHFPGDESALAEFDGTCLYEHADPRLGVHPDWGSLVFNFGRHEVRSFLHSSATFWLDRYHFDGLRLDAVASMLYLDYSRKPGEWVPNRYGGRENLEAIEFLRNLTSGIRADIPDALLIAEESTAWPLVTGPTEAGGLGFHLKWDMGWMHDTLAYFQLDPVFRKHNHNRITFRPMYAWSERFLLPLSHDEVVHGKGSLLGKMPGDEWQRFANLRLLYAYMYASPGKKLLFMGAELAPWKEWDHESELEWGLVAHPFHRQVQALVDTLNRLYRDKSALHARDAEPNGFEWVDFHDVDNSVVSFLRRGAGDDDVVLAVFNFTPIPRHGYAVGVPRAGKWKEILNTDAAELGGSGMGNLGSVLALPVTAHERPASLFLTLPPLGALFFEPEPVKIRRPRKTAPRSGVRE